RLYAEFCQRLRQPRHLLGELAVAQGPRLAVLALPHRRSRVRPLSARPAVDAVPGEVELPAAEPCRRLRPARKVADPVPGPRELEAHVLDRRRPEPLRLLRGEAHQLPVIVESELPCESHRVRALADLLARPPDHVHRATLTCDLG